MLPRTQGPTCAGGTWLTAPDEVDHLLDARDISSLVTRSGGGGAGKLVSDVLAATEAAWAPVMAGGRKQASAGATNAGHDVHTVTCAACRTGRLQRDVALRMVVAPSTRLGDSGLLPDTVLPLRRLSATPSATQAPEAATLGSSQSHFTSTPAAELLAGIVLVLCMDVCSYASSAALPMGIRAREDSSAQSMWKLAGSAHANHTLVAAGDGSGAVCVWLVQGAVAGGAALASMATPVVAEQACHNGSDTHPLMRCQAHAKGVLSVRFCLLGYAVDVSSCQAPVAAPRAAGQKVPRFPEADTPILGGAVRVRPRILLLTGSVAQVKVSKQVHILYCSIGV